MSNKVGKTIGLLRKLQNVLPRPLKSVQYNAALAITGAIRETVMNYVSNPLKAEDGIKNFDSVT